MHDVAKMELVKLDIIIKKQRYSLFIKFETVNLILLGVAFPEFESKRFNQCLAQNVFVSLSIMMNFASLLKGESFS